MKKSYVNNRFPAFAIAGSPVAFDAGLYETEDPDVMALIEGHEWYGVFIHPRDGVDAEPLAPVASTARMRHGARNTRSAPQGHEAQLDNVVREG